MKITNEEYDRVIAELIGKLHGMITLDFSEKLKKELSKEIIEEFLTEKAGIEIVQNFEFVLGDLIRVFGYVSLDFLRR